ncbi:MAG: T9SS type A sorting domain-containing protein, partial [Bacteroidota bacterium]
VPHYLDEAEGLLYCSAKVFDDGSWFNHFTEYDVNTGEIELIPGFSKTSNVDWLNFNTFFEYGDHLYFRFGSVLYRKAKGEEMIETYITNFDYSGLVGQYLFYHGDQSDLEEHVIYDLEAEQQLTTFTSGYADDFYLYEGKIYFFSSRSTLFTKTSIIYQFDPTSNELEQIYSALTREDVLRTDRWTRMERVGDNLIYNVRREDGRGLRISVNLTTEALNPDFTFSIGNVIGLHQKDLFVLNDSVYFFHDGDFYVSDGLQQPRLATFQSFGTTNTFVQGLDGDYLHFDGRIYRVHLSDDFGYELHSTDGQSVRLLKDIVEGIDGGYHTNAEVVADVLYFHDGTSSAYYKSDGTEEGTALLFETPGMTNFGRVFHFGNKILFFAESDEDGKASYLFEEEIVSATDLPSAGENLETWYDSSAKQLVISGEQLPESVAVFDPMGRLVFVNNDLEDWNISFSAPMGIYLLMFGAEDGIFARKVFVK